MFLGRREQRQTLAIVAVGHTASRFTARLCEATARLYPGDPPISAVALHDELTTRSAAERALGRVRGVRGRDISLSPRQRRALLEQYAEDDQRAQEAAVAVLHQEMIRHVHRRRYPLENVLWIGDSQFLDVSERHVRELRRVLNTTTLTVLCFASPEQAREPLHRRLIAWGDVDPHAGAKDHRTVATTLLVDALPPLARAGKGRYLDDFLAWGLASLLFAPLQDKQNQPFRVVVERLASTGHPLAALAVDVSAVPDPPPARRGVRDLFRRRRPDAQMVATHLKKRTAMLFAGEPATTSGTLNVPPAPPPEPIPAAPVYGAPYGAPPYGAPPAGAPGAAPAGVAPATRPLYASTGDPGAAWGWGGGPPTAGSGAGGAPGWADAAGAVNGAGGAPGAVNGAGGAPGAVNGAANPSDQGGARTPLQVSYLVPFRPRDKPFEALAAEISTWLGRAYGVLPPNLLHSRRGLDLPRAIPELQGRSLCQVTVLFGIERPDR